MISMCYTKLFTVELEVFYIHSSGSEWYQPYPTLVQGALKQDGTCPWSTAVVAEIGNGNACAQPRGGL